MKNFYIILAAIVLASCGSDQNKTNKANTDNAPADVVIDANNPNSNASNTPPPTDVAQVNIPAGDDGTVYHYVCADECEGSGSNTHGDCPVCSKPLAHNQAFHATQQNATPQISTGDLPADLQGLTNNGTTLTPPVQTPEPAQNAQGVWHYTCPSGCSGGSGSAIACSSCGTTLAHNAAYHN